MDKIQVNELKASIRCCTGGEKHKLCGTCPRNEFGVGCQYALMDDALEYIEELETKIEILQDEASRGDSNSDEASRSDSIFDEASRSDSNSDEASDLFFSDEEMLDSPAIIELEGIICGYRAEKRWVDFQMVCLIILSVLAGCCAIAIPVVCALFVTPLITKSICATLGAAPFAAISIMSAMHIHEVIFDERKLLADRIERLRNTPAEQLYKKHKDVR